MVRDDRVILTLAAVNPKAGKFDTSEARVPCSVSRWTARVLRTLGCMVTGYSGCNSRSSALLLLLDMTITDLPRASAGHRDAATAPLRVCVDLAASMFTLARPHLCRLTVVVGL